MKALLLKPDNAKRRCTDYEQLLEVYLVSEQWRRSVITCLFCYLFFILLVLFK